jgi:hypothetical protein
MSIFNPNSLSIVIFCFIIYSGTGQKPPQNQMLFEIIVREITISRIGDFAETNGENYNYTFIVFSRIFWLLGAQN